MTKERRMRNGVILRVKDGVKLFLADSGEGLVPPYHKNGNLSAAPLTWHLSVPVMLVWPHIAQWKERQLPKL